MVVSGRKAETARLDTTERSPSVDARVDVGVVPPETSSGGMDARGVAPPEVVRSAVLAAPAKLAGILKSFLPP